MWSNSTQCDEEPFIVTGALGVVGAIVASQLTSAGAKVAMVDLAPFADNHETPKDVLRLGGVDLCDENAATSAVAIAAKEFGSIDGLVTKICIRNVTRDAQKTLGLQGA